MSKKKVLSLKRNYISRETTTIYLFCNIKNLIHLKYHLNFNYLNFFAYYIIKNKK
jgi:hypothetical protein